MAEGAVSAYHSGMVFTLIIDRGESERRRDFASHAEAAKIALNYHMEKTPIRIACPDGRTLALDEFNRARADGDFGDA